MAAQWTKIWDFLKETKANLPTRVQIDSSHIINRSPSKQLSEPLTPNEHYFGVYVNQLFLTNSREWFKTYDPIVLVVTEFTYDTKKEVVPFIVGPTLLKGLAQVPQGMIFRNTRVAGIHPYRGGVFTLTVILGRIKRGDFARDLLGLVEKTAGALDFSSALSTYTKLSGVLLDGFEKMFGLEDSQPLVGHRMEFDTGFQATFTPGFFALIDCSPSAVNIDHLWVIDGELYQGSSEEDALPFRSSDFVLYSIGGSTTRNDLTTLPFYPLYQQMIRSAAKPDAKDQKRAKANLATLFEELLLSPDLTQTQADDLADQYLEKMNATRIRGESLRKLSKTLKEQSVMEMSARDKKVSDLIDSLDF